MKPIQIVHSLEDLVAAIKEDAVLPVSRKFAQAHGLEPKRTVPAEHFMQTLAVNVDNKEMPDSSFRDLVRNTLDIIQFDDPRKWNENS